MQQKFRTSFALKAAIAGFLLIETGCGNQSASGPIDSFPQDNQEEKLASALVNNGGISSASGNATDTKDTKKEELAPKDVEGTVELEKKAEQEEEAPAKQEAPAEQEEPVKQAAPEAAPEAVSVSKSPAPEKNSAKADEGAPAQVESAKKSAAVPSSAEPSAPASKQDEQQAAKKSQETLLKKDSKLLTQPAGAEKAPDSSTNGQDDGVPDLEKADKNYVADNNTLTFEELYSEVTVRGMKFSDKLLDLKDKKVVMEGYMAPPLGATVSFFVLTKIPLAICPFCSSNADWPADIVVISMPKNKTIEPTEHPLKITGTLSVGSATDDETGFVSLIRIEAENVEVM